MPLFIRWPGGGIGGGRDIDALAAHIDLLPTLVALCGLAFQPRNPLDGRSLVPLIGDTDSQWPERIPFGEILSARRFRRNGKQVA